MQVIYKYFEYDETGAYSITGKTDISAVMGCELLFAARCNGLCEFSTNTFKALKRRGLVSDNKLLTKAGWGVVEHLMYQHDQYPISVQKLRAQQLMAPRTDQSRHKLHPPHITFKVRIFAVLGGDMVLQVMNWYSRGVRMHTTRVNLYRIIRHDNTPNGCITTYRWLGGTGTFMKETKEAFIYIRDALERMQDAILQTTKE